MRRDAKAASTGSATRQVVRFGHTFRGGLDARRGFLRPAGRGLSTSARCRLAVLAALVVAGLLASIAPTAFGAAVTTEYIKSFGPDGAEGSNFQRIGGVAVDQQTGSVYVLDGEAGALYKFQADGQPLDWGGSGAGISGNEIAGLAPYTAERNEAEIAVDSTSHVIYVTEQHSIRAFQEDGEPALFTTGPGAGTSEIPIGGEVHGVAVDANGVIYASEFAGTVGVYAATGELLTSFAGASEQGNLAVSPHGTVYVAVSPFFAQRGIHSFIPDSFPVTSATTYTTGVSNDMTFEPPSSVGVDPVTSNVYVVGPTSLNEYDSNLAFIRHFGRHGENGAPGEEGQIEEGAQGVAVVGGGEQFQFYVGNTGFSPAFSKVEIFGEKIYPGPPSIESNSAIDVTSSSATLRATINPNTFATSYHFEYGLGDCASEACTSVPVPAAAIGSGHHGVSVLQTISGLQIGTTYHYRVVAENSQGVAVGPDRTLTSQLSGLGFQLADNRAWELVSPVNKNGGGLTLPSQGVTRAAADGGAIAYQSEGSIEASPDGNRALDAATILSRRGAGGWSSKDLTSPHTEVTPLRLGGEFKVFSTNLERAAFQEQDSTLLSPEASERTPYLRENTEPAAYTPLVTGKEGYANVPPGTVFGGNGGGSGRDLISIRAANPSLSHIVLQSFAPLVTGAASSALYEWEAGRLHPVSELPASEGGGVVLAEPGSGTISTRHTVSNDGTRVFWTPEQPSLISLAKRPLYLRDTSTEETARIDVVQPGATGSGEVGAVFAAANAEGTVVFFTDTQQLTEGASSAGRDLYRCTIGDVGGSLGCAEMIDLSAPLPGSGENSEAEGLLSGVSEDGTFAYFVAQGVLDTEPNQAGETAQAGAQNLYLWHEGSGVRFVAALPERDGPDWGGKFQASVQSSRLAGASSPNGRYLVFMSERSLTGYDNRDAASGQRDEEIFRYDALLGRIDCVSCNPSGASPAGLDSDPENTHAPLADPADLWTKRWVAATLPDSAESEPTSGIAFYQPRAVHDNGRVFFNAIDSLVPADSNRQWDVYQYEPTGVGDCSASSGGASVARSAGGCVSLISSGTGEGEAAFLDSSESGEDVFFLTSARLSVLDEDREIDVYDAHVDGIPAVLAANGECLGEACQPAAIAPNDPALSSSSFKGPGNLEAGAGKVTTRCAKAKRLVRRKGKARCVARKRQKHKRRRSRAGKGRRAGR